MTLLHSKEPDEIPERLVGGIQCVLGDVQDEAKGPLVLHEVSPLWSLRLSLTAYSLLPS